MNISIVGLPYFGKKLYRDLREYQPNHRVQFFDTYNSRMAQIRFALNLPFTDLVLSLNGVSDFSGSIELAYRLRKKICFQWQGTDVMLAVKRKHDGSIRNKYIRHGTHLAVAPWLTDELNEIGIPAKTLDFKWCIPSGNPIPYKNLSVYSYLAEGKESFYGWNLVKQLAAEHPDIPFYIAGSHGLQLEKLENIHFLGWLSNEQMQHLRENCAIYLRLPEHDGYSYAVLEALAAGNEVLWTRPGQHCHLVDSLNISEAFNTVSHEIKQRNFERNLVNIEFVRQQYDPQVVMNHLIHEMQQIIG